MVVDFLVALIFFQQSLVYFFLLSLLLLLKALCGLVVGLSTSEGLGRIEPSSGFRCLFRNGSVTMRRLLSRQRRQIIFGPHHLSFLLTLQKHSSSDAVRFTVTVMAWTSRGMCLQVQGRPMKMDTSFIYIFKFLMLLHLNLEFFDFVTDIDGRFGGFAAVVPRPIDLVKFI